MTATKIDDKIIQRIYHRKWNSQENIAYHRQIYTVCKVNNLQIPYAWAREVYELLRDIEQKFPKIQFLTLKETNLKLKLFYRLNGSLLDEKSNLWISNKIALTIIILILKNAYYYTIDDFLTRAGNNNSEFELLTKVFQQLNSEEILEYKQREPRYIDSLALDDSVPTDELKGANHYLSDRFPDWEQKLNSFTFQEARNGHTQNPRLLIFLKLANKFSEYAEDSIERAQEILLLDKFSHDRVRALFENEVNTELSLKLYELGARNSAFALQNGELDGKLKNMREEYFFEKEKSVIIENTLAFYKIKSCYS